MVHFFNAYSNDSICLRGPLGPLGITGTAAIIGIA